MLWRTGRGRRGAETDDLQRDFADRVGVALALVVDEDGFGSDLFLGRVNINGDAGVAGVGFVVKGMGSDKREARCGGEAETDGALRSQVNGDGGSGADDSGGDGLYSVFGQVVGTLAGSQSGVRNVGECGGVGLHFVTARQGDRQSEQVAGVVRSEDGAVFGNVYADDAAGFGGATFRPPRIRRRPDGERAGTSRGLRRGRFRRRGRGSRMRRPPK